MLDFLPPLGSHDLVVFPMVTVHNIMCLGYCVLTNFKVELNSSNSI